MAQTNAEAILVGPTHALPACVHLTRYFEQELLLQQQNHPQDNFQTALIALKNGTERKLNFKDFSIKYKQLSNALKTISKDFVVVQNGDSVQKQHFKPIIIGICLAPSIELILAVFAVLHADFVFVPLDESQPTERLHGIMKSANIQLILTDKYADMNTRFSTYNREKAEEYARSLREANENYHKKHAEHVDVPLYDVGTLLQQQQNPIQNGNTEDAFSSSETIDKNSEEDQLAAILFTSGSTGIAKGVPIRHAAFMNMMQFRRHEMPFGKDEMGLLKSAFTFIDGIIELFEALLQLRPLLILPKHVTINPDAFFDTLNRYPGIERIALVPSHMLTFVQYLEQHPGTSDAGRQQIKLVILDGEELTAKLVEQIFRFFPGAIVYNIYGTTETCGDNTFVRIENVEKLRQLERGHDRALPVGKLVDNFNVYVLDESTLKPVEKNKIGEIFFSGVGVAHNYVGINTGRFLRNHLQNDNKQHSTLYQTGDLGLIDAQNSLLYLAGRSDDLAKIRGQRIHLSELNAAAASVDGVIECASAIDKQYVTQRLITFFCTSNNNVNKEEVKSCIEKVMEKTLPVYAIPIVVPFGGKSLPQMVNGKIDRKALLDYYHERVAKLDPDDMSLLGILSNVLGLPKNQLKMSRSFTENGGNSLNSVVAITELNKHGFNIELADFLQAPSLEHLVAMEKTQNLGSSNKKILRARLPDEYMFVELSDIDAQEGADFISIGNIEFGELEQYLKDVIDQKYISNCIAQLWPQFLSHDLSLGIRRRDDPDGELIALIMGCDENKPIDFTALNGPYFDTLEELLGNPEADVIVRNISKDPGEMVAGFALNVKRDLDEAEKVKLFYLLQVEEIRRAKAKGYKFIVGGDTSPVTQGVGKLLGYKTLQTVRINQMTKRDGSRPFITAPDDHVTTLDVLYLDEVEVE